MRSAAVRLIRQYRAGVRVIEVVAELEERDARLIFKAVQARVKAEVETKFRQISALRRVSFKLNVTAGSDGISFGGAIEISIPGT